MHNAIQDGIDYEKVHSKKEDGHDYHRRGRLHFLESRGGHLLHLGTNVVIKTLDPLGPGFYSTTKAMFVGCCD